MTSINVSKLPKKRSTVWSKSPNEPAKYSDWTIQITVDSKVCSIYSVHKVILGLKSEYFDTVFSSDSFSESVGSCSSIDLPKKAADQFEQLLEYCYHGSLLSLDPKDTVPIVYLADYFGIDDLKSEALGILKDDLAIAENVIQPIVHHLENIRDLNDQSCLKSVADFFRSNAKKLYTDCMNGNISALSELDQKDLWRVIASATPDDHNSKWLSYGFVVFCNEHEGKIDSDLFKLVTSPTAMPAISQVVACRIMSLEQKYNPTAPMHKNSEGCELTDLQERCLKVFKRDKGAMVTVSTKQTVLSMPSAVKDNLLIHLISSSENIRFSKRGEKPTFHRIEA